MSANTDLPVLFAVETSCSHDEAVLILHGELDLSTQPELVSALADIEGKFACVVLDLADLTFIDAGNIGVIHRACRVARMRGSEVVLRSPNLHLLRILELTGLGPAVSTV